MKREELIKDKNYVVSGIQLKLLNLIEEYMDKKNLNREKLAKELNVTKGYVSQLLNVTYDHKISKLVELALACDAMPLVNFVDLKQFIKDDADDKYYELMPMIRPKAITFNDPVEVPEDNYQLVFNPINELTAEEPEPSEEEFEEVA
jgi:transcriptional regulator with XRE-family HTH domain